MGQIASITRTAVKGLCVRTGYARTEPHLLEERGGPSGTAWVYRDKVVKGWLWQGSVGVVDWLHSGMCKHGTQWCCSSCGARELLKPDNEQHTTEMPAEKVQHPLDKVLDLR